MRAQHPAAPNEFLVSSLLSFERTEPIPSLPFPLEHLSLSLSLSKLAQLTSTPRSSWLPHFPKSTERSLSHSHPERNHPDDPQQQDRNSSGSSAEEDSSNEVEDLLWAAQTDLIGHSYGLASTKLRRAVELGSSAACATLGKLLYKGMRIDDQTSLSISLSPPRLTIPLPSLSPTLSSLPPSSNPTAPALPNVSTPTPSFFNRTRRTSISTPTPHIPTQPVSRSTEIRSDRLEAARLFIRGLELEVAKFHEEAIQRRSVLVRRNSQNHRGEGSYGEASEEEGAEGLGFNLERCLDLVVGLTDSYRFGILQSDGTPSSLNSTTDDLWTRGALVAEATLRHPALVSLLPVLSSSSTLPSGPPQPLLSRTRSRSLSTDPSRPSLSPRRTISRSYAHPSTSIPAVVSFVPSSYKPITSHHLPPQLKLALTIQIHLYYLLALQTWPLEPIKSEEYWNKIVKIAERNGGSVGTKEGDEIVAKTEERLRVSRGALGEEQEWKFSKEKKRKSSLEAITSGGEGSRKNSTEGGAILAVGNRIRNEKVEEEAEGEGRIIEGEEEGGDALAEIWRIKLENVEAEKGRKRKPSSSSASSAKEKNKVVLERNRKQETSFSASKPASNNPLKSPRAGPSTHSNSFTTPSSHLVKSPATPALIPSSSISSSVKTSKFHFATSSSTDYPSPPDTPNPSPPGSRQMTKAPDVFFEALLVPLPFVAEPEEDLSRVTSTTQSSPPPPPLLPPIPFPKVRRASSNSSFQPPSLLPRIRSSSSISTLPPDFFSARHKNRSRTAVTGSNWSQGSGATVGSSNDLPGLSSFCHVSSPMGRMETNSENENDEEEGGGSIGWRKRFTSLRGSLTSRLGGQSTRPSIPDFNPFRLLVESQLQKKKEKSARETLRKVLKRDDEAAGVGMYWADRRIALQEDAEVEVDENGEIIARVGVEREEGEEEAEERTSTLSFAPSTSSGQLSKNRETPATSTSRRGSNSTETDDLISELPHKRTLRSPRSFIDVTTSRQSSQCPVKVIYTPATPDHHTSAFGMTISNGGGRPSLSKLTTRSNPSLHPHSSSSSTPTASTPSSTSSPASPLLSSERPNPPREVGIDPLLLELERKSRVGVRTVCVTCGKKGLNFPACRDGRTFCSRECRVGPIGAVGKGKGKEKEVVGV